MSQPDEIARVFEEAASEGREGRLQLGSRAFVGRFGVPRDPAEVAFRTTSPTRARPDERVAVELRAGHESYDFEARVRHTEGCEIVFERPAQVRRLDRRSAPRVSIVAGDGVVLVIPGRGDGALGRVIDLSAGGVALQLARPDSALGSAPFEAWLELPDGPPLVVQMRLSNQRSQAGSLTLGLEIVQITPEGRRRLSDLVDVLMGGG